MKKCPNCYQTFSDDNSFCLNDGTTLQAVSEASQMPTIFLKPDSVSTQFTPRPPDSQPNSSNGIPGWLYAVLGAMAAIIVALLIAFFIARTPAEKETTQTERPAENKAQTNVKENMNISVAITPTEQIETPPITAEAVRSLLIRWEKAQDAQNFRDYQSCYGQPFKGIKRVESATKIYNYATWLDDRRKILGNAIGLDVEIKNLQISVEGDAATAEFDQYYRSLRHSDWGPKIMKFKMFPDGAKIVYEELKAAYPLS